MIVIAMAAAMSAAALKRRSGARILAVGVEASPASLN
jgi:hypothetical protein